LQATLSDHATAPLLGMRNVTYTTTRARLNSFTSL
jgi:hypothetical protein